MANSSEESEQITDDDGLPPLVTDSEDTDLEDTDLEDNNLPELGTGNEGNKPKPRPPARRHRAIRELKPPELPTGKPPLPADQGSHKNPRRRFTKGTLPLREVTKYQFRPVSPVDPSAPAAVDHFGFWVMNENVT